MTSSDIPRTPIRRLAGDYKARGLNQSRAWSQFVVDRGMRPEIDAMDFYLIYRGASPEPLPAEPGLQEFEAEQPFEPEPAVLGSEYGEYGRRILVHMESTHEVCEWRGGQIERKISGVAGGELVYEVRLDDERGTRRIRRDDFEFDGEGDEGVCWLSDEHLSSLAASCAVMVEVDEAAMVC